MQAVMVSIHETLLGSASSYVILVLLLLIIFVSIIVIIIGILILITTIFIKVVNWVQFGRRFS